MRAWTWARAPWPDARGRRESCGLPATAPGGGPALRLRAVQARREGSGQWANGKAKRKPWCVVRVAKGGGRGEKEKKNGSRGCVLVVGGGGFWNEPPPPPPATRNTLHVRPPAPVL